MGRERKNNSWENLTGFRYAHRGLFNQPLSASVKNVLPDRVLWDEDVRLWREKGRRLIPENSMRAFCMAVKKGFGSELDVHLTKDEKLCVFHDSSLLRMCGVRGTVEEMTLAELQRVPLLHGRDRIPEFADVLALYTSARALTERMDARTGRRTQLHLPLIIELKAEKNAKKLCGRVMEEIDRYPELNYCIESFDPRVVWWFRKNRPDVIRGQLTENFMKSRSAVRKWGHLMTLGMWSGATDLISRPDFVSSKYADRKNIFLRLEKKLGVRQVHWTIKNRWQMAQVDREGGLSIFERFIPFRDDAETPGDDIGPSQL